MRSRLGRSFEFLTVSALDLFASALGVFVLVTFVLLPFYLKQPSLEAAVRGAQTDVAASLDRLNLYRRKLADAQAAREEAEALLVAARQRLAAARTEARREAPAPAAMPAPAGRRKTGLLSIPPLDLVIVLDTTGSMRAELRDLQADLLGIIRVLHRLSPSLALGIVAYRDHDQEFVTRAESLRLVDDRSVGEVLRFIDGLKARGGGDVPEAVEEALAEAYAMSWREGVEKRILVIGDAPARPSGIPRALDVAARFRAAGGQVDSIFTGPEQRRDFFERLAVAGGGEFRRHKGEMIESILLSILYETRKPEDRHADQP